jgi:arylsulfatase A-like enzyme
VLILWPLLISCGSAPLPAASPTLPASTLHSQGAGTPLRLTELLDGASLTLPARTVPKDAARLGDMPLTGWTEVEDSPGVWVIDSPVELQGKRHGTPPTGLEIVWEGKELPYRCMPRVGVRVWCADDDQLYVSNKRNPDELSAGPSLRADRVGSLVKRLDVTQSGLSPQEFVRYELTLGPESRPGLLLPAPTTLSYSLTLPEGATLDLALALVPLGLTDGPESDGAGLRVLIDGDEITSFQVPGEGFRDAQIDLKRFGGRAVTLTFETIATGDADWDMVFLAEPRIFGAPTRPPRRVLVVGIDTARYASFTQHGYDRDTTAPLDEFAAQSVIFDRAWTPAPRTRPSFRTATTGYYPFEAMDAPTMGQVLKDAGFTTAGVTANIHLVPRFGFNDGFDWWIFENSVEADVQIERAKGWLHTNRERDSFMFLHIMDPHAFYDAPAFYANRYVETDPGPLVDEMNRWQIVSMGETLTDDNKAWLQARYDGELRYTADQLAELFSWVLTLPGETLIVLHSDHGEEFWEHGSYEHNHTLYSELTHAVLWVRPPAGWAGGPHRVEEPVGLVDIAATVYDLAGVPEDKRPKTNGSSLRPYLDAAQSEALPALRASLTARALPIGHLMYDTERWAAVADDQMYILHTWSGEEELFDLIADPLQQNDLAPTASRATLDARLARLADATGWPTGPGLRIEVGAATPSFTMTFAEPVRAQIIDPEADSRRRANVEWGQRPKQLPTDVGVVEISPDGLTLTFKPGPYGRGIIGVVTGSWQNLGVLNLAEPTPIPIEGGTLKVGMGTVTATPGAVILVQDSELQRLMSAMELGGSDQIEALKELGYIE